MIISGETEDNLNSVMRRLTMDLVSDTGEMLNILAESKENETAVGINAPVLGDQMCVTAVEDILIDQEITIVLKSYDITGYMLEVNKIKLSEIKSVCPFKSHFQNPYMRNALKYNKPL
jgi:hypothetical protein